jgi:predicted dienelactone hydrolase
MVGAMRTGPALLLAIVVAGPAGAADLDPGRPGRFAVGVATLDLADASRSRRLVTEVWYPATAAGRDTPLARGRFPLVLVAHGHCGFRTNYEYLTVHLASWGFVVAAPDFPGFTKAVCDRGEPITGLAAEPPEDLVFLRRAFRRRTRAAARFAAAAPRRPRIGLIGHSLGGQAALGAARADRAVAAVVALAPAASAATGTSLAELRPRRAVMAMAGTADRTVSLALLTRPFFDALPAPAFLVTVAGGSHSGFTDVDDGLAPAALARQQALVRRYAAAFLGRYVAGRRRLGQFLVPGDAEVQGPDVTLIEKHRPVSPHARGGRGSRDSSPPGGRYSRCAPPSTWSRWPVT